MPMPMRYSVFCDNKKYKQIELGTLLVGRLGETLSSAARPGVPDCGESEGLTPPDRRVGPAGTNLIAHKPSIGEHIEKALPHSDCIERVRRRIRSLPIRQGD